MINLPTYLLNKSISLLSGVLELYIVYFDNNFQLPVMLKLENYRDSTPQNCENFDVSKIHPFNRDKNWIWITDSQMPFTEDHQQIKQLRLFDENKVRNLQIGLKNSAKEANLILYFVFDENNPLFGYSNDTTLSTLNKSLIANIINNTLIAFQTTWYELEQEKDKRTLLNVENENIQKNLYLKTKELNTLRNNQIIQFCEVVLNDIDVTDDETVSLSQEALEFIIKQDIDFTDLKEALQNTVKRISYSNSNSNQILIEPWHLDFSNYQNKNRTETTQQPITNRLNTTIQLLNRLENAGIKVKQNNQKLTGTNVGAACDIPISAPAITDAFQKHNKRILQLLNNYPDRWKILRNEFRPLQNIIDNNNKWSKIG